MNGVEGEMVSRCEVEFGALRSDSRLLPSFSATRSGAASDGATRIGGETTEQRRAIYNAGVWVE